MDKLDKIEPDEISVKELLLGFKAFVKYISGKRLILFIFSVLGFFIGIVFSIFQSPQYIATSNFVLEETAHGSGLGLSQYSGLASFAGIDIGSGSEKGLFQGDNILELYRSRRMIEKTLLTPVNINGKHQLLINRYMKISKFGEGWWQRDDLKNISFNGNPKSFSRLQDSVIRDITKYINKHILTVTKPDKKLSIINVEVKFKDEIFAKLFNEELVQNVNDFYIQTQTIKTAQNVKVLQHQADSVRNILNMSIGKVGATTDENPNPNPTIKSLQVPFQKKQIDVQANSAIYGEVVKNLELAKISLRQETPLIQIIDEPILPLEDDKTGIVKAGLTGLVSGFFLSVLCLIAARFSNYLKKISSGNNQA
jgi:capsule polysaccharide export protein KpsE/RkpR